MHIATNIGAIFIATLALAAADALADGEIYRWVDENGTVHFDKQPPADSKAEQVDLQLHQTGIAPSASSPDQATPDQQAEPQVSYAQQKRDEREKRWEENAKEQEITDAACAQRHKIVSELEWTPRIIVEYEDGTVEQMDDNVRVETLDEAKAYIAANCNN
jgi:hypothetical protein